MHIDEAIRGRRSIGRVKQEPVSKEVIGEILEAANYAPSHHATEPWRFWVMTGAGRDRLAAAYADIAAELADPAVDTAELRAKSGAKAYRSPVVIAVGVSPSSEPGVSRAEEFAAAHAAVQNMLLKIHALGLGAIWRSGEPMYHPRMKTAFGLQEHEELVALVYLGEPETSPPAGRRRPVAYKTVWFEA